VSYVAKPWTSGHASTLNRVTEAFPCICNAWSVETGSSFFRRGIIRPTISKILQMPEPTNIVELPAMQLRTAAVLGCSYCCNLITLNTMDHLVPTCKRS
jgi:hypothetical protein